MKNSFGTCLLRLKQQLGMHSDKDAGALLGLTDKAFSARKRRDSFPEKELHALANKRPDLKLDVNYVLNGVESAQLARLKAKQSRISKSVGEGLEFEQVRAVEIKAMTIEKYQTDSLLQQYVLGDESAKQFFQKAADFVMVPHHDVAASAGGGAVIHDEQIVDHLAFKREWLTQTLGCAPDKVCVIQVRGDSMTPTINDADLLLLDMRTVSQRSEGVYVIQLQGSLLVKRLRFKINGAVDVISDNVRYGTETLTTKEAGQLEVLGRVVWHGCKF